MILRKIIRFLSGFLFPIFISLLLLAFLFSKITEHENAKMIFNTVYTNVLGKQISTRQVEEMYNDTLIYCREKESVNIPLIGENMTLNCSEILSTNSTQFLDAIANKSFETIYYKDYGCDFLSCLRGIKSVTDAIFVFSLTSYNFFNSILLPLALATILTGAILFLSIETWTERCKVFGIEFISIGIFSFLVSYIKGFTLGQLPLEAAVAGDVFDEMFNVVSPVLQIFFFAGIILVGIWIFSKFFLKKETPK